MGAEETGLPMLVWRSADARPASGLLAAALIPEEEAEAVAEIADIIPCVVEDSFFDSEIDCLEVVGTDCAEVRVLDTWTKADEVICGTGDLDMESIVMDDSSEPSGKVDPTPRVKIFDGVVQQSAPLPWSQQNCPKEGSPH